MKLELMLAAIAGFVAGVTPEARRGKPLWEIRRFGRTSDEKAKIFAAEEKRSRKARARLLRKR